jgi:hypothetical protein
MRVSLGSLLLLALLSACAAPSRDSFKIASIEKPGTLQTIPLDSARIVISLPQTWQGKPDIYEKPGVTMYQFRRQVVYDSLGRGIIPNLAVFAEKVPPGIDLVEYSVNKRIQKSLRELSSVKFAWATPGEFGLICYLAEYDDPAGIPHTIYVAYSLVRGTGIQVIIDGTTSVFDMLDPEYKLILNRLQFMR